MIYYTADLHFSHYNIIRYCDRPFDETQHMNDELIRRWQERVKPDDTVWVLGDVAARMSQSRLDGLLSRLPGHLHLVVGNHDYARARRHRLWESVNDIVLWSGFVLSHKRQEMIPSGFVNLHGHSHGELAPTKSAIDVGVDCWAFRPVTESEIREALSLLR
jgi:calcineurin-like phosphoesterase family protein